MVRVTILPLGPAIDYNQSALTSIENDALPYPATSSKKLTKWVIERIVHALSSWESYSLKQGPHCPSRGAARSMYIIIVTKAFNLCLIPLAPPTLKSWGTKSSKEGRLGDFLTLRMNDWAASLIAAALFAFLSPGLVFQMPGKERPLDFMNMKTSLAAIFVHLVIYGLLLVLFLVILHVHLYV